MDDAIRAEVAVMLARQAHRIRSEHEAALAALADDLRAELAAEVAAVTTRIDSVHTQALRELTKRLPKGDPA